MSSHFVWVSRHLEGTPDSSFRLQALSVQELLLAPVDVERLMTPHHGPQMGPKVGPKWVSIRRCAVLLVAPSVGLPVVNAVLLYESSWVEAMLTVYRLSLIHI